MGRWKKPPAAGSEKPPAAGSEKPPAAVRENPPAAGDKNPSSCSKMKSPFQLVTLEKSYAESSFPSESTQRKLSAKLGLTQHQLKGWFCRRRFKDRQKLFKDRQPKFFFPSSETEMEDRQETDQEETDPHASDQEETGPNAADYEKDEVANHQEEEEFEEKIYKGKRKHPRLQFLPRRLKGRCYKRDDYGNDLFPPPQVTVSSGSSSNLSRHSMASSRTRPSFSGTGVDDRQETNSHASHETVGNEEVEHLESGNEKTPKGKGKHPELSYGSKCSLPTVAMDVVNRNIDIEKQLNQLLSVVKEQQSNLPKLVKRCSAPVVELKTKMAELEKLVATLKQQQAEEKSTAEHWKNAFEKEKALREKAEKELCEEMLAWADLVLQLGKAKKQNVDMFNTASERFGKMRQVSGLSKHGSSSPPAASSG